jgi:hypothetical protein
MTKHPIALAIAWPLPHHHPVWMRPYRQPDRTGAHPACQGFEDKGNLKGSIVELKNAIQKNPNSPQARLVARADLSKGWDGC